MLKSIVRMIALVTLVGAVVFGQANATRAADAYVYVKFGDGTCTAKSIAFPLYYAFNTHDHVFYHELGFVDGISVVDNAVVPVPWLPGTGSYIDRHIIYSFPAVSVPYQFKITYDYSEVIDPVHLSTVTAIYKCGTDGIARLIYSEWS